MVVLTPYLSVPVSFLANIRTRREAEALVELGTLSRRFDATALGVAEDRSHRQVCEHDNLLVGANALLGKSPCTSSDLRQLRAEFVSLREEIKFFVEANSSSAREFDEVGCPDRARQKDMLTSIERVLVSRLDFLCEENALFDGDIWGCTLQNQCAKILVL